MSIKNKTSQSLRKKLGRYTDDGLDNKWSKSLLIFICFAQVIGIVLFLLGIWEPSFISWSCYISPGTFFIGSLLIQAIPLSTLTKIQSRWWAFISSLLGCLFAVYSMMIWAIHPVVIILFVVFAMIPMIIEFVKDIIPNSCQMGGILGLILGFVANVSVKYNKYISTHVTLSLIIGFLVMTLVSLLRLWPAGLWQSHSLNINQVITISVALFTTAIVMIGGLAIVISYVEKKKAVNSLLELKNQSIIGQGGNDQD